MFRKLIKKLKKKSVYWRIAIVYIIFLIVKWFMYEVAGIEIGKEGFGSVSSLIGQIKGNAAALEKLCSKQSVKIPSNSAKMQQEFKRGIKKGQKDERDKARATIKTLRDNVLREKKALADCRETKCVQVDK